VEDFIKRHRRLVIAGLLVAFVGLILMMVSFSGKSEPTSVPDSKDYSDIEEAPIPYSNSLYSIDYNENQIDGVPELNNIAINAYIGYQSAAVSEMYDIGLDPTDYKITFNHESPFKKYE
jgi:hypothetical protein